MQLRSRKQNVVRLFEQMQQYQFDSQLNSDQPLESHVRALTDDDVDWSVSLSVCVSHCPCVSVFCLSL